MKLPQKLNLFLPLINYSNNLKKNFLFNIITALFLFTLVSCSKNTCYDCTKTTSGVNNETIVVLINACNDVATITTTITASSGVGSITIVESPILGSQKKYADELTNRGYTCVVK